MKTPKICKGLRRWAETINPGYTFSGCCGAYLETYGGWYGHKDTASKVGIMMYRGKKELPLIEKEQLHHLNTRNGPMTFAIKKN